MPSRLQPLLTNNASTSLHHPSPCECLLGLGNHAGAHACDRKRRVAERVIRFEFTSTTGVTDRIGMPLEPGAPSSQGGMGQRELGLVGDEQFHRGNGGSQIAIVLEFLGGCVALISCQGTCLLTAHGSILPRQYRDRGPAGNPSLANRGEWGKCASPRETGIESWAWPSR